MKKIILPFLVLLLVSQFSFGQNAVQRNNVLLETFGGTWCVFCPGSALAADDMIANGHDVAIIEHHIGDSYEIPAASTRDTYYSVSGYPTQVFDGTDQSSGGNANTSIYPSYLSSFNNAIPVLTPIELSVSASRVGRLVSVTAVATQVASVDPTHSPRVFISLTESEIPENWFVMDELSFVNRGMYPNAGGSALNLTGVGTSDSVTLTIEMDPSWEYNHAEIVTFVQDLGSKVVYNSDKKDISASAAQYAIAATGFNAEISETFCGEAPISPEINVFNYGSEQMTTFDVKYTINGGTEESYTWNGTLDPENSVTVQVPNLDFTPIAGMNDVELRVVNPLGNPVGFGLDDTLTASWSYPEAIRGQYFLAIKPDLLGAQITWEMLDPDGMQLAAGGPYTSGNTDLVFETFDIGFEEGCHSFAIYDAGGNGIKAVFPGYYELRDEFGTIVAGSADGDFGAEDVTNFRINYTTGFEQLQAEAVQVFPNPSKGQFTAKFSDFAGEKVEVAVYQMNGARILSQTTDQGAFDFDLSAQPQGVYLLQITTETASLTQKISKQ